MLWNSLIVRRLTVFPLRLSAGEIVSVSLCESVANVKVMSAEICVILHQDWRTSLQIVIFRFFKIGEIRN